MRVISWFMAAASAAAITACGSSGAMAPVVYGTQPDTSGRIYNSPADYTGGASGRTASAPMRPVYASASPVQLSPLTSVSTDPMPPPTADPVYDFIRLEPAVITQQSGHMQVAVQPGDTVYAVSRRTGSTPQSIIAENNLVAPYGLKVGQVLRVPSPGNKIANYGALQTAPAATPVKATIAADRTHVVRPGDTLYSISRSTGASVPVIAQANRLREPYTLKVGEQIRIPAARETLAQPIQREAKATPAAPQQRVDEIARNVSYAQPVSGQQKSFEWPVKGAVIGNFGQGSLGRRNDGINIAAPVGTPVRAAADGEVVYRGSELDGYGNLLLIKHGGSYVTAYAHNDVMLVKKGETVRQGQVIAKVGQTGAATEPQLHFEIRHNLKAVDPIAVLGK